jgi:hypothetical protein
MSRLTIFLVAGAYLLLPGHPDSFFRGIPLGLGPLVVLTVGVFALMFFHGVPDPARGWTRFSVALACLCAIKLAAAVAAPTVGWIGRYYPNERFEGPYRRSTDFPHLDATRIDRAIEFRDDELPVYFFNEADFNREIRREVTMPVTVAWTGYVQASREITLPLIVSTRGNATVALDGRSAIDLTSRDLAASESTTLTFSPGDHRIDVRYVKPANTDPLIAVRGFDSRLLVTPGPSGSDRRTAFRAADLVARAADAFAGIVFVLILGRLAGARREGLRNWWRIPSTRVLCAVMFVLFLVQGIQAAVPHVHRAVSLSGGDDWLAFEARGREILTGGLLMRFGRPLGSGEVFYYYPGYSYFLAAIHRLAGEDLAGPLFVHFLLLFGANVMIYRLAEAMFDRPVAVGAIFALVGIEEMAFMRHYTVTLLSENLYFLTVPVTVFGVVRFLQHRRLVSIALAGLAGGVSAVTRPAMMLYLVPCLCVLAVAAARRREKPLATAISIGTFLGCWFSIVFLVTLRNYVVTGSPTLISESPAHSFILYNLPPGADADRYLKMYSGGLLSSATVLFRILIDHPLDFLRGVITKTGFSFGMVQWMGGRLHPELVLVSGLYFGALVSSRAARAFITWPVHGFIAVHLLAMMLTMPSNYGYRLILPMYLFLPVFAARFAADWLTWMRRLGRARLAAAESVRPT